jgi:hypothetical protein
MLARRIRTGFHRIGLALAVLFGVPGIVALIAFVPFYWLRPGGLLAPYQNPFDQYDPRGHVDDLWHGLLGGGAFGVGAAVVFYVLMWTLGWIISGFAGDGENK